MLLINSDIMEATFNLMLELKKMLPQQIIQNHLIANYFRIIYQG